MENSLLRGKRILIFGVANHRSIAWAIARACAEQGAEICLTYQNDTFRTRVTDLAKGIDALVFGPVDASQPDQLDYLREHVRLIWGDLDGLVHSMAFAQKEALQNRFLNCTERQFSEAMLISCFSLTRIASSLIDLIRQPGGSVLTLTSYGSEKVLPNYGLMGVAKAALEASVRYLAADLGPIGVRVNAISAGPVKTISSGSIPGFREIIDWNHKQSFLRRNVRVEEIGNAAVYMLSELSSATTGEVLHVDSGNHAQGMMNLADSR